MIEFGFAITLRVKQTVINDPVPVTLGVVINQINDSDAFDHTVRGATVLTAHTINLEGVGLVQHRVIKQQITIFGLRDQVFDLLPDKRGAQTFVFQIAIDTVVV